MKNRANATIVCVLSTACFSCGNDNGLDLSIHENEIVINGFNVENAGHTQSINSTQDLLSYANSNDYNMMSLSSSVASIRHVSLRPVSCVPLLETTKGSGNLTSASRITTANHVVASSRDGVFDIYFDGDEPNLNGNLRFDKHLMTNPPTLYENPLLAKRLFGLGLDQWAEFDKNNFVQNDPKSSDPRVLLRWWEFEWDDRQSQNFLQLTNPNSFEGRDLAILKAKPHLILNSKDKNQIQIEGVTNRYYINSSGYTINNPGPYFTIATVGEFGEDNTDVCNLSDQTRKVYGTHNNVYPYLEIQNKMPIYSTGYLATDVLEELGFYDENVCIRLANQNILVNYTYTNTMRTSLDLLGGSSGGGFYDASCKYLGDGMYGEIEPQNLVLKGIFNSAYRRGSEQSNPIPDTSLHDRVWYDGFKHDYLPNEYGQQTLAEMHSSHTILGYQGERWARRGTSYDLNSPDPFRPIPNQPIDDGCPGDGGRPNCNIQLGWSSSTGYSDVSTLGSFSYELTGDGTNPINQSAFNEIENLLQKKGNYELLACEDPRQPQSRQVQIAETGRRWNLPFGMVQGFTGSSNTLWMDPNDVTTRVDVLSPICVPWSSSTWLDNWTWTKVITNRQSSGFALASTLKSMFNSNSTRWFWEYLGGVYERRRLNQTNQNEVVHPPSFKTCPPNYYLNGVSYWKTPDTHELVGIKELICEVHRTAYEQAPSDAKPPLELRVPLASSSLHEGFFFDTPNKAKAFDLSATIGLVRPPSGQAWAELAEDRCPERQVVIAAILKRPATLNSNINMPLDYFHLYCSRAPRGGKP